MAKTRRHRHRQRRQSRKQRRMRGGSQSVSRASIFSQTQVKKAAQRAAAAAASGPIGAGGVPAPAPAPAPALTAVEQQYVTNAATAAAALPPSNNFLKRSYYNNPMAKQSTPGTIDQWGAILKNYANGKGTYSGILPNDRYKQLQNYKTKLTAKVTTPGLIEINRKKKLLALNNRIQQVLGELAKQQQAPAAAAAAIQDTHAGVVIKFSDGKVFYTKPTKGTNMNQLGFPKGKIENIKYTDASGKEIVRREDSEEAALRELKQETGFFIDGNKLKRRYPHYETGLDDPKSYTINKTYDGRRSYPINGKTIHAYYYIIELNEDSSPAYRPNITTPTIGEHSATAEDLTYEIAPQYGSQQAQGFKYNAFSQIGPL